MRNDTHDVDENVCATLRKDCTLLCSTYIVDLMILDKAQSFGLLHTLVNAALPLLPLRLLQNIRFTTSLIDKF